MSNKIFEPFQLGDILLQNRIVMASLTRTRADPETGIPNDLHVQYYSQRASAGLILTECAPISRQGDSFLGAGGIYTKEQVEGWKRVVDAVHAKGGKIFIQIWHGGRAAQPSQTGKPNLAPSAIAITDSTGFGTRAPHAVPKEMTKEDIRMVLEEFRQGALNAKEAGFDGIELHGANGYLIDGFLRDGTNQRTDEYGGSAENRSRLPLEIMDALIEIFGAGRVGIKLSPVGRYQDMYDSNPIATYGYLLSELDKRGIAYVQLREPEAAASKLDLGAKQIAEVAKTFRPYFKGTIMINENQTKESLAEAISEGYAELASYGRYFIANPDLVERLQNDWPLNEVNWKGAYGGSAAGYIDYPFYQTR